ncbi:MAG: hypothetical protein GXY64_08180 [Bacteroidales bacterium]|nr:hypothetical protein [Bacteroidales bacterium]
MKHLLSILLLMCVQSATAQRLIPHESLHHLEELSLPERVEPLLTDGWYQDAPNNNMCPLDKDGNRCLVGCVATAMTQVMHYWQWPLQGTGSHEYTDEKGCGQTLSSNFSQHKYDWSQVLDFYREGEYSQQQANAIAQVSSDCGIAVNMRYGSVTSGAHTVYQPLALVRYFDYDPGAQIYFRDFYSLEEITLMLKQELAAGRPVLISGTNHTGAHAFVLDGYDEQDRFHLHLGNPNNVGDGWSSLQNMTPSQEEWYDADSPENGMSVLQIFVMGIVPSNHPEAKGVERYNFGFQYISAVREREDECPVYTREQVKVTVHDLSNMGWNTFNDSVALMLKRDNRIVCPLYVYDRTFLVEEIDDTTYNDTICFAIPPTVERGLYTIVPMYRDNAEDGGKEWREALTSPSIPNYLIAEVQDQQVTLSSDTLSTGYLTIEDIDFPDFMIHDTCPEYSITFKNHRAEMAGRFYLVLECMDGSGKTFILQAQGLSLQKDEVTTRRFHKTKLFLNRIGEQFRLRVRYLPCLYSDDGRAIEMELPREIIITVLSENEMEIASKEKTFNTQNSEFS